MGLIKEPLEIDFLVDLRQLTKKEQLAISDFIKADKEKLALKKKAALKTWAKQKEVVGA